MSYAAVSPATGTAPLARALLADPKILPSATSVRFTALVVALVASTGSIYGYIGLTAATGTGQSYNACMTGVPLQFGVNGLSSASDLTVLGCTGPYAGTIAAWTVAGIVGVVLATIAAYLAMPWWTLHVNGPWWPRKGKGGREHPWWSPAAPGRLPELRADRRDQRAVADRVRYLAGQSRLDCVPRCVLDQYAGATAFIFGRRGGEYLRLGLDLGRTLRTEPRRFDGIVLHELAHVRNRDSRPTFLTYAAWRAFVLLALVPYVVTIIVHGSLPGAQELASVVALTVLTYLTRNAVLRVRETYADARASLVDPDAVHCAVAHLVRHPLARTSGPRLPTFLALHPAPQRRLDDLGDPEALGRPEGAAMFAAGIAAGSVATNVVFTFWVGALSTSGIRGVLVRLAAGSAVGSGPALLSAALVYGPVIAATLPLLAGFACVTMWRAQLGALAGAPAPAIMRHAGPLALGFMVGLPLALNYAIAGTWGIFDSGLAWDAADFAVSALTLCVLLGVMFRWAAESATAWIPVTAGSLRRQCLLATLIATLGALVPFFFWLLVHDNALITTVSDPQVNPHLRGWPLVGWTVFSYPPLASLSTGPACMVLVALPCLYAAAGAARRAPRASPRWIPDPEPGQGVAGALRLERPPSRIRPALLTGLGAAIIGPGLALVYVVALRAAVHGALTRYAPDGLLYVVTITTWITLAACLVAAIITARSASGMRLTMALLSMLVGTAIGSPLSTLTVFVGACGDQALSCAARGSNFDVLYGSIGTTAPLEGAIVVALLLIWGQPMIRGSGTAWSSAATPAAEGAVSVSPAARTGGAAIVGAMCLGLAAGAYCCARYLLKI